MLTHGLFSIALLVCSNIFMTLAWYGHLKMREEFTWFAALPLIAVIGFSWCLAFFEYCLQVPANRLVITGMEKKVGKEAWNDPPTTRNTLGLPLWDKSLYFALFYIQRNVPFSEIRRARRTITERQLLDDILSFDRLMINRKQLESRQKAARANLRKDLEKKVRTTETKVRKNNTMKSAQSMKTMRSATNKSKSPSTYTRMKKS